MTRSGNEAVNQAAIKAQETGSRNIPALPDLPLPDDTANLRQGPDLHPGLLALLPLVGVWRGEGEGNHPETGDYRFGQQLIISHDGQNYLNWQARSWVIGDDGDDDAKPDLRESGFWRIGEDDSIELLLTHAEGWIELFYGNPLNQTSWELVTDVVITSASGAKAGGAKRLYGLVEDGDLAYVEERVDSDGDLVPRASAKLSRYAG
ncbi:FABP family protein [Williamsia sp.]|uniref:FABP family protein n=1 Tax=Williamsia sp. TaxID=1872085 RepID=UPI002F94AD2A